MERLLVINTNHFKTDGAMGYNSHSIYEKNTFSFNRNVVALSDL